MHDKPYFRKLNLHNKMFFEKRYSKRRFRSPPDSRNSSGSMAASYHAQLHRPRSRSKFFKCKKCRIQHALRKCPAFGKACLKCRKPNRFVKCCFVKPPHSCSTEENHSVAHLHYLNKSKDENNYINENENVKLVENGKM